MRSPPDQSLLERLRRPVMRITHTAVLEEAVDEEATLPAPAAGARRGNSNVISLSAWRRGRTPTPKTDQS
jgi:hypothetical protein